MQSVKQITAQQAADLIQDGDNVILGGFIGAVVPESIEKAIEDKFLATGHPRHLGLIFAAGQGDAKEKANNRLAHEGLVSRAIGGHWGLIPRLQKLANEGKITGYNLPQGVICHLFRDSAAGKMGTFTHVGLGTFVDPRVEGGKINAKTTQDIVTYTEVNGVENLFYKKIDANIAILRGTTADTRGNITMEDECLILENLAAAQLVHNQGGKVIVQVKRIVPDGSLDPQQVKIPGIFVDAIVVAEGELHMQTFAEAMNENYVGRGARTGDQRKPRPLDVKKIIARRAAMELKKNAIVNYGIGAPEVIAQITDEEHVTQELIATVEPGAIGGSPAGGLSFGASAFPEAIITQDQMFDFYDGGGLDQAFLGLAETDAKGDLNVSKFGVKIAGCGGFINITQNAKQVFFCGSFTAGESDIVVEDGQLNIRRDGHILKFIKQVQQITFSSDTARKNNKTVYYITERAVFKLTAGTIELVEIAPGIDLHRDILDKMEFMPKISPSLKTMDARIFSEQPMQLSLK
ncbi:acyl CoA:acetate/3-ketoacid CoA transferase [Enterobacter cloacae complex sp. 2024EL-00215]|uniref:Acetate CoA-transferase YdiF n=1 Tax=Enterobacter mori TaxID=539813 RepID=A0A7T0DZF0_9ENTR|nr:CoA-transferase [Enterobacter mori]MEB1000948.1 CoA-transferase [Citrobacter freundii]QPK02311.1 3-oxoacid CoA-transferase [Enterobacter mori]HAW4281214.1 3-oxoacid CoA-transferase [Escherichia coli]HDW3531849.1 3-oxoacid CoA-transferase [Citrobacter freundii]